jgi:hypothetical protein
MLEHYFWLLEFKFKFEFHCLNPFPKIKHLNPIPIYSTLFPIQPIRPRSLAARTAAVGRSPFPPAQQPSFAPAAQLPAAHLALNRQLACAGPAGRAAAAPPAEADSGGPLVIPELRASPPRTPPPPSSPSGARFPVRGPHAKESSRDYLRPLPPLDLLPKTPFARRLLRRTSRKPSCRHLRDSRCRRRFAVKKHPQRRARR